VAAASPLPPAPPPVVHLIDRPASDEAWELRIKGQYGGPDKVIQITRRAPAKLVAKHEAA